jgi:hypothetical protein
MATDWKKELKEIISSQQNNIKKVIEDRDKRENERLKKITEIKDIVRPRFEFIKELIEKNKYLISAIEEQSTANAEATANDLTVGMKSVNVGISSGLTTPSATGSAITPEETKRLQFIDNAKRGKQVAIPEIKEGEAEIAIIMPALSDVNRLDLMYQIEFKEEKPVLHAFELLSAGKMQNNGSAHGNFEEFVQDTLKRFLLSWFTRKEGTELDKERTFKIIYDSHGLK